MKALHYGDIDAACPVHLPTAYLPNQSNRHVQEHGQPLLPLVKQLLPVDQNQG
jgi:hypothetical protein